jgi:hypothetical protein
MALSGHSELHLHMSAYDPKRTFLVAPMPKNRLPAIHTVPSEASVCESVPMICCLRTQCKKFDLAQISKKQPRDIPRYETHTSQCSEWEHFETAGKLHRSVTSCQNPLSQR